MYLNYKNGVPHDERQGIFYWRDHLSPSFINLFITDHTEQTQLIKFFMFRSTIYFPSLHRNYHFLFFPFLLLSYRKRGWSNRIIECYYYRSKTSFVTLTVKVVTTITWNFTRDTSCLTVVYRSRNYISMGNRDSL